MRRMAARREQGSRSPAMGMQQSKRRLATMVRSRGSGLAPSSTARSQTCGWPSSSTTPTWYRTHLVPHVQHAAHSILDVQAVLLPQDVLQRRMYWYGKAGI